MNPKLQGNIRVWHDAGRQEALIRNLLQSQLSGVLATSSDGKPFCYLMAFLATGNLQSIFLAVREKSVKNKQVTNNSQTCFLIDNRQNNHLDTIEASALSVHGRIYPSRQSNLKKQFIARHPGLQSFVADSETNIMNLLVERYSLVSNFEDVYIVAPPA
ncbi:MAG: pyridoxamine 5'-phosphate oxidase family protein [Desulfovibrionales bacterium]